MGDGLVVLGVLGGEGVLEVKVQVVAVFNVEELEEVLVLVGCERGWSGSRLGELGVERVRHQILFYSLSFLSNCTFSLIDGVIKGV